ncbi:MAG: hypothetical protein R3F41_17000 [Gammaproteobacteria bacterium]|nr:hypothetical protein [Pseudomonadales bacterium]
MSKVVHSNCNTQLAIHVATSLKGELSSWIRTTNRGKRENENSKLTYEAIFTFDEPLICPESDVPLRGGYFLNEEGEAEVTQLIGRFLTKEERNDWIRKTFVEPSSVGT